MNNRPIIIFAGTSHERDHLRALVSSSNSGVLSFEKETICFDNIKSIDPQAIIIRTDCLSVVWRFVFAMHILESCTPIILLSNELGDPLVKLYGLNENIECLPAYNGENGYPNNFEQIIHKKNTEKTIASEKLLVGETKAIQRINAMLPNLKETSDTILITGEPGTGKELLSRMIASSNEKESIFIKIDCAILRSEKAFDSCTMDSATNGHIIEAFDRIPMEQRAVTVLLDKVDHLDNEAQGDVLFLLENQIDRKTGNTDLGVRFISTSETDLQVLVRANVFRKDLFYRLNAIPIQLPPLRDRLKDIPLLIDYFSLLACTEMKRSYVFPRIETTERLCAHNWPGNIDELERILKQFVATGDEHGLLKHAQLSETKTGPTQLLYQTMQAVTEPNVMEIKNCLNVLGDQPLKRICEKFAYRTEKKLMQKALETTNWNRKKAAALLNISYKSMLNKMKMYEIV